MKVLDIAEVAEQSGLPPSALRYYEEKGLIQSVGRNGLRRQFDPDVLQLLSLITLGKSAGFTLEEISAMIGPDGNPDLPRDHLIERADELEERIQYLTTLSQILRHVAECPAPSHMECPRFRKMLKVISNRKPTPPKELTRIHK